MALRERGADVVVRDLAELMIDDTNGYPERGASTTAIGDLPSALDKKGEISQRLEGRSLAVFLDYDGTLTPVVDDPAQASLSQETREIIKRLAAYCTVGIISGRDLADVQRLVGIEGIVYAGSHGFDIITAYGTYLEEGRWQRFLPVLDQAEATLRASLKDIPGARVERKRFAIAVHFRAVDDTHLEAVEERVDRVAAQQPELRRSGGKKIFELRPDIDWNKGKAMLSMLEALDLRSGDVVPLFIGDDVTDEDAFRAIRERGIGIVVGSEERQTAAHYALPDPTGVRTFLEGLITLATEGSP